jgi:hypothetical protein
MREWLFWLRWRYSPYWRGYRDGLSARERARIKAERLRECFD